MNKQYNIPKDFITLLEVLGNKTRFSVFRLLLENIGASHSALVKHFNDPEIEWHLIKLERAGIVHLKKNDEMEFYEVTRYGWTIVRDFIKTFNDYFEKEELIALIKKDNELRRKLANEYPNEWILFRTNKNRDLLEVIAHNKDDSEIEKIIARTEAKEGEFILEMFGSE